jgi:Flp pilus assembly protein TadB
MLVLGGGVIVVAMVRGVEFGTRDELSGRGSRFEVKPIHGVAVVAGLLALLLTRWVALGFGVAGAVVLVPSLLAKPEAEQQIARLEALGSWTRRLADLLSSGAASSLDAALVKSATVAPAVIATEVNALVARLGPLGTREALMSFAKDMDDSVCDEVVMSLIVQHRHGGRGLTAVLGDLAAHVEDETRMRRDVESDRAKPRREVRTVVTLTLVIATGFIVFDRSYLEPFGTAVGQFLLAGVVGMFGFAFVWLRRILQLPPGERLLVDADFAEQRQP